MLDSCNIVPYLFSILLLGGLGQLGTGLAKLLRTKYGTDNIILSDIIRPKKEILDNGRFNLKITFNWA